MPDTIRDGTGSGRQAAVNAQNELTVFAVTEPEAVDANEAGDAFNINTKEITLTDAVETPVIYLKTNNDLDMFIEAVVIGVAPSVGGVNTETISATFIRNPTAGTIISSPVVSPMISNRNYGSNKTFDGDVFNGATGKTMTDGDDHIFVFLGTGASRTFVGINEVLKKGNTFGVKIKPQTDNTSMIVYVAIILYFHA